MTARGATGRIVPSATPHWWAMLMMLGLLGGGIVFAVVAAGLTFGRWELGVGVTAGIAATGLWAAVVNAVVLWAEPRRAAVTAAVAAALSSGLCALPLVDAGAISPAAVLAPLFINSVSLWLATHVALGIGVLAPHREGAGPTAMQLRVLAGTCIGVAVAGYILAGPESSSGFLVLYWPPTVAFVPSLVTMALLRRRWCAVMR